MDFKKLGREIHGDKYDYSLVEYRSNGVKVKIICQTHGIFEQRPNDHISKRTGCPKCSGKGKTTEDFVNELRLVHGNFYDYSETLFKGVDNKILIICPHHGKFYQTAYSHSKGAGCTKCRSKKLSEKYSSSLDDFKTKANKIHSNSYDYSNVIYINGKSKIKIRCLKHGIFEQLPQSHLRGRGCPICRQSKGEEKVRNFLIENNIVFNQQHKFDDCRKLRPLPFDFYLPMYRVCVEYDGIQHFNLRLGFFGTKDSENQFQTLKENDKIKTQYCLDNNIKLIRIAYDDNDWKLKLLDFTKVRSSS